MERTNGQEACGGKRCSETAHNGWSAGGRGKSTPTGQPPTTGEAEHTPPPHRYTSRARGQLLGGTSRRRGGNGHGGNGQAARRRREPHPPAASKSEKDSLSPRMHGASPVSLQRPWVDRIPPPQHASAPPGLDVQPAPAQVPQLRGQLQNVFVFVREQEGETAKGRGVGHCCRCFGMYARLAQQILTVSSARSTLCCMKTCLYSSLSAHFTELLLLC